MKARTIALILLLATPAIAQNCGEQAFAHLDGLDPNMICTDPASGQKLVVLIAHALVGQRCTIVGRACDPEGDPMDCTIEPPNDPNLAQILPLAADGTFTFSVTRTSPGIEYRWVSATDHPDAASPQYDLTRMGTYAVIYRANSAPVLSAAGQSVSAAGQSVVRDTAREKQKDIQVARKLNGPTHFDNAVAPREGKFFLLARD